MSRISYSGPSIRMFGEKKDKWFAKYSYDGEILPYLATQGQELSVICKYLKTIWFKSTTQVCHINIWEPKDCGVKI